MRTVGDKPWLEEWRLHDRYGDSDDYDIFVTRGAVDHLIGSLDTLAENKLAVAAPAMARALCFLEFAGLFEKLATCAECNCAFAEDLALRKHGIGCRLDAALTAAGLDAAAREEVRAKR